MANPNAKSEPTGQEKDLSGDKETQAFHAQFDANKPNQLVEYLNALPVVNPIPENTLVRPSGTNEQVQVQLPKVSKPNVGKAYKPRVESADNFNNYTF